MDDVRSVLGPLLKGIGHVARRQNEEPVDALLRTGFDGDRIWAFIQKVDKARSTTLIRFAAWLYSTGVRDMGAIEKCLSELLRLKPRHPYAYFAPQGAAREHITSQFHANNAIREHKELEQLTLDFLGGDERCL